MDIAQETIPDFGPGPVMARLRQSARELYEECALQKPQLFLWFPVFLALGIGFYFSLPVEPPFILGLFSLIVVAASLAFFRNLPALRFTLLTLFLACLGFVSAQLRTQIAYTPILQKEMGFARVTGTIDAIEDLGEAEGSRVIMRDLAIAELDSARTPRKVRLRVRSDHGLMVGQRIEVLAGLNPSSPPVMPGAFDFQRHLYFQGIGAVGFVYKQVPGPAQPTKSTFITAIEKQRHAIARNVETHLQHPEAAIAVALLNGRMNAISKEDQEAMRDSGLYHLLSISGLHVGLFSGVVFFFTRLLMALIPGFALRYPIKKFAAVLAIISAVYYMLLAGSPIPTQRSVLMTGLFFLAIILDRSPISLRMIAFAALFTLLIFPESLLSASFQMSFAAVAALIWCFDRLTPRLTEWRRQAGFVRKAALYFLGVCLTTLIASTATAPFGLFHFQQFALFGALANLIAVPLMAFIIMPGVVGALFLMPVGFESLPLQLMGWGIAATLKIAYWASGMPHASIMVQAWPFAALVCLVIAALMVMLWRGHLRAFALVPAALALLFISGHRPPDILIANDYDLVGFYDGGTLHVSSQRKGRFAREKWAAAYGLQPEEPVNWPREGRNGPIACGEDGCRLTLKDHVISYADNPASLAGVCAQSDIVLSAIPAKNCSAALVIDLYDAKDGGAHAIWLDLTGPRVKVTEDLRGARPWSSLNSQY